MGLQQNINITVPVPKMTFTGHFALLCENRPRGSLWSVEKTATNKKIFGKHNRMQFVGRHILSGTFMLIGIFHTSPAHVEVLSQAVKQIAAEQRPQLLAAVSAVS